MWQLFIKQCVFPKLKVHEIYRDSKFNKNRHQRQLCLKYLHCILRQQVTGPMLT